MTAYAAPTFHPRRAAAATVFDLPLILSAVIIPKQAANAGSAYLRFARVDGSFAIVNAAARMERAAGKAKVALGGVGPTLIVLDVSDHFMGQATDAGMEELSQRAYDAAHLSTGDIHSDVEYRRRMAGVFARRAVEAAARKVQGGPRK